MKRTVLALFAAALAAPIAGCGTAGHHLGMHAQAASAPPAAGAKTYDMRDDATDWIKDPNVHAFYQATRDAFAQDPEHLDRAAYQARSREIFTALAKAHNMPVEPLLVHLKDIPDQMILIATRDPHSLDSYDSFVVQLFGPQRAPAQSASASSSTGSPPPRP